MKYIQIHANNMLFDGISDLCEKAAEIQFFCIVTSSFSHPACVSSEYYTVRSDFFFWKAIFFKTIFLKDFSS